MNTRKNGLNQNGSMSGVGLGARSPGPVRPGAVGPWPKLRPGTTAYGGIGGRARAHNPWHRAPRFGPRAGAPCPWAWAWGLGARAPWQGTRPPLISRVILWHVGFTCGCISSGKRDPPKWVSNFQMKPCRFPGLKSRAPGPGSGPLARDPGIPGPGGEL